MFNQILLICLLFYISTFTHHPVFALEEGDACTVGKNPGICRSFNACPAAIQALQQQRQNPVICAFPAGSGIPIVCCAQAGTTTTTTTTTTQKPAPKPIDPALAQSKSYQKCVEYAQYVYEYIVPPTQTGSQRIKVNRCNQAVQPLVVGGEDAFPREFPHMTALGYEDGTTIKWGCGGALVSERFVLTAGHCLFSVEYGEVKRARVGDLDLVRTDEGSNVQEFGIAEIVRHPEHKPPSNYNDIGLLRLNGSVKLNPYSIPACLRFDPTITEKRALATGWGKTKFSGDASNALQKVTLELFTQEECNSTYAAVISNRKLKFGIVPDTQLCAGHHTQEKDTCQGDSGGPLQVFQKNDIYCMYSLIGVTSFGSACGVINSPGVYTRVSAYLPWIESIIWS